MRVCARCGTPASVAVEQGEPICSDGGLVAGHSYIDVDEPTPDDKPVIIGDVSETGERR